ncbi:hypothetical protein ASPWEDRAFT_41020 [Aspergillus wentii DTO 134E9]|uniref:Uncharacterized protein n=1 Tax=Aspergillus wentii DTO 134E9 TaxID=1073089 RepID=A0A1L9RLI0_ASPWE|nr:uncharacterized protein ASPWEDRAFT_41020 [Aspergillus wentii DTO 134E9]OJJ35772.1 hypothetical protein ASPWEDRAFT_41020 [Aspergillus wentii DTO 134E9]
MACDEAGYDYKVAVEQVLQNDTLVKSITDKTFILISPPRLLSWSADKSVPEWMWSLPRARFLPGVWAVTAHDSLSRTGDSEQ